MKKFIAGATIYVVSMFAIGTAVFPDNADANHKVWMFCHKADWHAGYPHLVKQSGVHTNYRCYSVGWWVYVNAPWPH